MDIKDNGPNPYVVDIEDLTTSNENFRTAAWTGSYLQMTLMTIPVGGQVGLEVHEDTDQFLRLEQGKAKVVMGKTQDNLDQEWTAEDDWAIFIPAGMWHNIINDGDEKDETGCGDQTMAATCALLQDEKPLTEAASLAVLASTLQFHKIGIKPVTRKELSL